MKLLRLLFIIFLLPVMDADAQKPANSSTAAGTKPFKTGGSKSFWMGSNYRKEWNTVVSAPVINLATEYGGLKPVKRGGVNKQSHYVWLIPKGVNIQSGQFKNTLPKKLYRRDCKVKLLLI